MYKAVFSFANLLKLPGLCEKLTMRQKSDQPVVRQSLELYLYSASPRSHVRLDRAVASPETLRDRLEGRETPTLHTGQATHSAFQVVHRREGPDPAVLQR